MDKNAAVHDILWSATDDWTGLWEVAWALQTTWPELRGEPAKAKGRALLHELLDQGLIYVCFFNDVGGNKETVVTSEQGHELIDDSRNWEPPDGFGEHVRFAATKEGEKRMFRLESKLRSRS